MGKIKRGILGGFSGRVGNIIGGAWKGIAYMRSMPLSVANPKTAAQVNQRSSFKACVALAQLILTSTIKPLWDRFASGMSGFNEFVSLNVKSAYVDGVLQPAYLKISKGSLLPCPIDGLIASAGGNNVELQWTDNSGVGNALATDKAYAVVINTATGAVIASSGLVARNVESLIIQNANFALNDTVSCYLAFKSLDGYKVSDTEYAGGVVGA